MTRSADQPKEDYLAQYKELPSLAVETASGVIVILVTVGKVGKVFNVLEQQQFTISMVLPLVLFVLTVLLGFAWFVSGKHELALLGRYYGLYAPNRSFGVLPVVLGVAVVVVLLAYLSDNLLFYGLVYWLYLFFNAFAYWLTTQHILHAIRQYELKPDRPIPSIVQEEVYLYYVRRPHHVVVFIQGAMASFAVACGLASRQPQVTDFGNTMLSAGYGLLIAAMVLDEVVVWVWRARFYRRIQEQEDAQT